MSPAARDHPHDPQPDTLFGGTLRLHQPARGQGYRVNVDAVLLAWFAGCGRRAKQAVDLGAGVGGVGLCLLYRDQADHVLLVEKEGELSTLSARNIEANGWQGRGEARCADVASASGFDRASADLVVCNPPYVVEGRGRPPRVAGSARVGSLAVFTRAARLALGPRGRACFVYPAPELATLMDTLRASGLEPKRLCLVHASADQPARVALVEALPAKAGGLVVAPALVERAGGGASDALAAIFAPRDARPMPAPRPA